MEVSEVNIKYPGNIFYENCVLVLSTSSKLKNGRPLLFPAEISGENGKIIRKHGLRVENSSFSFIEAVNNGNKRCHTTDVHVRMSGALFRSVNNIQFMIPDDKKLYSTQRCSTGRF